MNHMSRAEAMKLVGQRITTVKKDGAVVSGYLHAVKGDRLILAADGDGKTVRTSAFITTPLVLFDLLSIGLASEFDGGFGGFGGFDGFGGWWF